MCGPFVSGQSGKYSLTVLVASYSVLHSIYDVVSYYPYLWLIGLILITLTLLRRNHAVILRNYIVKKDEVSCEL